MEASIAVSVIVGTLVYCGYVVGRVVHEIQYGQIFDDQQYSESHEVHPSTGRLRGTTTYPDYTDDCPHLLASLDDIPDIRRVDTKTGEVFD